MRLFIAILFSQKIMDDLYGLEQELRRQSLRGSFPDKDNLHLTLAFLGETPPGRVEAVVQAMQASAGGSFPITIPEFGKFLKRGDALYWCGMKATEPLICLQAKLMRELKAAGFAPDDKPFSPHITIARRCSVRPDFSEEAFRKSMPRMEMEVRRISLMKSERIEDILTYTEIAGVDLQKQP